MAQQQFLNRSQVSRGEISPSESHHDMKFPNFFTWSQPNANSEDQFFEPFCLFEGDDPTRLFQVNIPKTSNVASLRAAILEKNPELRGVSAHSLVLWKVAIPIDQNLQQRVGDLRLRQPLLPAELLLDVFPTTLDRKSLYVIVKCTFVIGSQLDHVALKTKPLSRQETLREQLADTEHKTDNLLASIRPALQKFICGKKPLPLWEAPPKSDPDWKAHIHSLGIPMIGAEPNLLLHRLGELSEFDEISSRVNAIFQRGKHTFLVNTSGSGKTRLLFEGGARNWVLYFSAAVDASNLGSTDMHDAITQSIPESQLFTKILPADHEDEFHSRLEENRAVALRRLTQMMLARLLIFREFLMVAKEHYPGELANGPNRLQRDWLILQLIPSILFDNVNSTMDIFAELTGLLHKASDSYLATTARLMGEVEGLYDPNVAIQGISRSLFCILDESQVALAQGQLCFRGKDTKCQRSSLREIMGCWYRYPTLNVIVAGTGLSLKDVQVTQESGDAKVERSRIWHDTGSFEDPTLQDKYLQLYLPDYFLQSDRGKRLLTRVHNWLRGRHRFTASFLQMLLQFGITSPHRLLNTFIAIVTNVIPTDGNADISTEPPILEFSHLHFKPLNFSKLLGDLPMMTRIHQVLLHYLVRGDLLQLTAAEKRMVQYGFAYFRGDKIIRADEPLALLAAAHWFSTCGFRSDEYIVHALRSPPGRGDGWEDFLALYFVRAFEGTRPLDEVFTFHDLVPSWSHESAELVALSIGEEIHFSKVDSSQSQLGSFCLGFNATTYTEDLAWFSNPQKRPFLFPSRFMGPDLIFVVRLSNGNFIWVVVQAKYCSEEALGDAEVERAIRTLTPSKFYTRKDGKPHAHVVRPSLKEELEKHLLILPNSWKSDFGKFSLLRVVATYPAEPSLTAIDNDKDCHAIVTLDMELCKRLTVHPRVGNILEALERDARGQKRSADMENYDSEASETKILKVDRVLRSHSKTLGG